MAVVSGHYPALIGKNSHTQIGVSPALFVSGFALPLGPFKARLLALSGAGQSLTAFDLLHIDLNAQKGISSEVPFYF